jgi:hypothetical protein
MGTIPACDQLWNNWKSTCYFSFSNKKKHQLYNSSSTVYIRSCTEDIFLGKLRHTHGTPMEGMLELYCIIETKLQWDLQGAAKAPETGEKRKTKEANNYTGKELLQATSFRLSAAEEHLFAHRARSSLYTRTFRTCTKYTRSRVLPVYLRHIFTEDSGRCTSHP